MSTELLNGGEYMATREQQASAKKKVLLLLDILKEQTYEEWLYEQHIAFIEQNNDLIVLALESMKEGE